MAARPTRESLLAAARLDAYLPVHFNPHEIDALIAEHGNVCEYRRAVLCPCSRIETQMGAIGCPVCRGIGWSYPTTMRCTTRLLDQSRSGQSKIEPAGAILRGEAQFTFRIGILPALGDLVLPECETHVVMELMHRNVQQIDGYAEAVKLPPRGLSRPLPARSERLLYPEIFEIEAVVWIHEGELVVGVEGVQYRQKPTPDGGLTIEFMGSFGPQQGEGYSVRYIAQAAYMIRGSVPMFRHEGDVAFPYRSSLSRLDKVQEMDLR